MQMERVETTRVVTRGSDGNVYDLHRIAHRSRPPAPEAPWIDDRIEWLTSTGAVVQTDDETVFRLGKIVMLKVAEIEPAGSPSQS